MSTSTALPGARPPASRSVTRPYRFAPPRSGRPLIRRSRLLRRLHERWDHRVTVLTAGAGFGKSSLLVQALDENALAPRGDDHWFGCGPGDRDLLSLAEGLALALGVDLPQARELGGGDPDDLASTLAAGVWSRSPRQVCLVVDDAHEVPPGTPAARFLDALLGALPTNGHLVLSGRHEPPVALARLAAQGEVCRLGEDDLAFGAQELADFAALRDVPLERLSGLGGWPALAELRTLGRGEGVGDFLDEEVLADRTPRERRAIATVAALGGADQALLDAVLDEHVDLAELLDGIPLVTRDGEGWHAIHSLWSERLSDWLDEPSRSEAQRRAGLALLERDARQAITLLVQSGAEDDLRRALQSACRARSLPGAAEGFTHLYRALPLAVAQAPEGELLAGLATMTTDLDRGIERITAAARLFAAAGDDMGLLTAVEHLGFYAHWREDVELLGELWELIGQLDHLPEAAALRAVGQAVIADVGGDATGVLRALDGVGDAELDGYWTAPVAWLRGSALLALGYPERALRHAEVAVAEASPSLRGALSMLLVNSLVHCGRFADAHAAVDRMIAYLTQAGHAYTLAMGHTVAATVHSLAGRLDQATQHLARARQHAGPEPSAVLTSNIVATEAALALASGDEVRAAELLASQTAERGVHDGRQVYGNLRRLPSLYVLVPGTRSQFEADDLGPCYREALDLARALAAGREAGDVGPAAALTPRHWAVAPAFLPVRWRAELAAMAVAGGDHDAELVLKDLGPAARPALRRLVEHRGTPKRLADWARTLLDALPAVPAASLEICVLGPTTVRRGGRAVEHPHWRRERVRALLLLLVARGGGTREEVAGALWPDLDTEAALRNLRVTLSYLLSVLEPDRGDGSPSCFVRTESGSLRLSGHEWLQVDAWEMERLLDEAEAAEKMGEPSVALDLYRRAVALYNGPYLADAGYEEWALPHRDRLCARFVAAAVRTGELALAAGEVDEALRLASRAIEAEPWSEVAHRLAVATHLARGDRAAARRAMDTCLRQLDELGVPPTEDTTILIRALRG